MFNNINQIDPDFVVRRTPENIFTTAVRKGLSLAVARKGMQMSIRHSTPIDIASVTRKGLSIATITNKTLRISEVRRYD